MERKQSDVIGLSRVLGALSQMKSPFGILIAQNTRRLKSILKKYEEDREAIQDKYFKKDEEGNFVGVVRDGKRVEKPVNLQDIECSDRIAFENEIKFLDEKMIEMPELKEIDCSRKIYWSKRDKDITIGEWLNTEISPVFILILDEFDLLKNLD